MSCFGLMMARIWKRAKKLLRLIVNDLSVLSGHSIMVSASVSYEYDGRLCHANWGDDLNHYMLRELSRKPVVITNETLLARHFVQNYVVIGSVIEMLVNKRSVIWGAGLMHEHSRLSLPVADYRSVRGPLTQIALREHYKIDCPEIYGDPALLLPLLYHPTKKKKYCVGIIPHYADLTACDKLQFPSEAHRIAIRNYGNWHDFIDEILECETIISSSLHGLIVAEAYGIPSQWIEFDSDNHRDNFKYHDFYASIGKHQHPIMITEGMSINQLQALSAGWKEGTLNLTPLLRNCPFELKLKYKNEIN